MHFQFVLLITVDSKITPPPTHTHIHTKKGDYFSIVNTLYYSDISLFIREENSSRNISAKCITTALSRRPGKLRQIVNDLINPHVQIKECFVTSKVRTKMHTEFL